MSHASYRWVAGRLERLAEIGLAELATLAPQIGTAPVVLRRFAEGTPEPPAFAALRRAPLRHAHPDGLRLLEAGLACYRASPGGPFPRAEPIYLKSEAFRKWRPAAGGAALARPGAPRA